jgi:hypothetical protein
MTVKFVIHNSMSSIVTEEINPPIRRMDEFVIACRSYQRPQAIVKKTWTMLRDNNLLNRLYIFVANQEEYDLYSKALEGKAYAGLVIGEKGGANAIRAICRYFPVGKRILFIDDDQELFFTMTDPDGGIENYRENLKTYIDEGFHDIDIHGYGSFTFSYMTNKYWLEGKPHKEFRPYLIAGCCFGCRNDLELITTINSNKDDLVRTCRFIDRYGGTLLFWRAGFRTKFAKNPGGLYDERRDEHTGDHNRRMILDDYEAYPAVQEFATLKESFDGSLNIKLKRLPTIRKILAIRNMPLTCDS